MKIVAVLSLFLSLSLCAEQMPQLPQPPQPIQESPTSIMEETERVNTNIVPQEEATTQACCPENEAAPITLLEESREPQEAVSPEFAAPTPPVMETPKTVEQIDQEEATVDIGLSADVRQQVADLLNRLLADEYVLYTKTLKYHWNVKGIVFHDFHAAFKEQYERLFDIVDSIAERARALGKPALGSLHEFSTFTRLKEINAQNLTAVQMVKNLLADHEAIIKTIRGAIDETAKLGDQGTSNFLQDLILKHEKIAWMLRATAIQ